MIYVQNKNEVKRSRKDKMEMNKEKAIKMLEECIKNIKQNKTTNNLDSVYIMITEDNQIANYHWGGKRTRKTSQ